VRGIAIAMIAAGCAGADTADDDGSSPDASGPTGGDAANAFVLDAWTTLPAGRGLVLHANLPVRDADCGALPVTGAPCGDVDADGLTDAWEDLALDRLRPVLRLDEAEPLIDDTAEHVAMVGRVAPVPASTDIDVVMFVLIGYSIDYGSCGGISGHDGDPERVAIHVRGVAGGGAGDVEVVEAYTAAHEYTATDHGHVFGGGELADLIHASDATTGDPRWVVLPSRGKHATYGTAALCESASQIPCFAEECVPDGVADPAAFDLLPPVVNAGEDAARRIDDLTPIGFPGDTAWGDQPFCGGHGGSSCSAKVRDKLLIDPFGVM
jgi:hypothetical protein